MSLKHYLFLLIGALIIVFSTIQYYSIEQVRAQVNEEITSKTRTLSQVALNAVGDNESIRIDRVSELVREATENDEDAFKEVLISENIVGGKQQISEEQLAMVKEWQKQQALARDNPTPAAIHIKIENTPNKEVQLDDDLTMVTGENTKTISITRRPQVLAEQNSEQATTSFTVTEKSTTDAPIKAVLVNRINSGYTVDFDFGDDELNFQKIVSFDSRASTVDQYFTQLRWQLLLFTVVGLLFAYLLARHISRPLSNLSQGFKDLGEGDLGVQLQPIGVDEMRKTIMVFNQTSKRLAQLQTLEKNYQQQQQMAELGEVARGLAHTLRNPLNTIGLGISQMQAKGVCAKEQAKIAQQIQAKILHVDETIKSLMHLASTDVNRHQAVNVMAVVSDIMLEMSINKPAAIKLEAQNLSQAIYLDSAEAEVRAMFHALISNAVEASTELINEDKPSEQATIGITLETIDNGVRLIVRDAGKGVSSDDIDNLFKPHFTTKSEGAGMGLFIVKRICEMYYKGSIHLRNMATGGCEATLILENAQASDQPSNATSGAKKEARNK